MWMLEARQVTKEYPSGGEKLTILQAVDLSIAEGSCCAVVGPSGSGKTTLLGLCAGLDSPTTGSVRLDGMDLATMTEDQRAALRREKIGFIFQNFQLVPSLTALENVLVPLELLRRGGGEASAKALLDRVGLSARFHHYPLQLSGGEQQRVAVARAFVHRPKILFADEPTGNLDAESSARVVEMMFALNQEVGTSIMLVTHDLSLAKRADHIVTMESGRLSQSPKPAA